MLGSTVDIVDMFAYTPLGLIPELWDALARGMAHDEVNQRAHFESLTNLDGFAAQHDLAMAGALEGAWGEGRRVRGFVATTKGLAPERSPVQALAAATPTLPSTIISNACVSGAQALIEATDAIEDGLCDIAVVVATDFVTSFVESGFASLQAASGSRAHPFDRRRDGLTLDSACSVVALAAPNERQRNPRIISYGCSNDANHISGPSRDGSGLALAIERALEGIDRSEIRAICAHGTATQYNDAMEARAFHTVFNGNPPPVFGIKGAIGHTLGAAGLIEVIISAMVATEGVIPPTVGFEQGEEDFPLDVVHGKPRKIKPGYVLTTNSGFGGMNTAIIVGPGKS